MSRPGRQTMFKFQSPLKVREGNRRCRLPACPALPHELEHHDYDGGSSCGGTADVARPRYDSYVLISMLLMLRCLLEHRTWGNLQSTLDGDNSLIVPPAMLRHRGRVPMPLPHECSIICHAWPMGEYQTSTSKLLSCSPRI